MDTPMQPFSLILWFSPRKPSSAGRTLLTWFPPMCGYSQAAR